jgi:hypothetical protein
MKAEIKIKENGKKCSCFVLKDYWGKGRDGYNPIYYNYGKPIYKLEEIEFIKEV